MVENLYGIYIEKDEAIQITISVLAISFALALVFASPRGLLSHPLEFAVFVLPLLVTVGSGFILHEMAHKLVALYYGAQARFQMWYQSLILMLVGAYFGFLFAAPGAVYIYSEKIDKRQNGIISIAGPVLNVMLALFFIGLEFIAPIRQFYSFLAVSGASFAGYGIINGILHVWRFGAAMNIMLALFNMIPAVPFDGSKVFRWSWPVGLLFLGFLLYLGTQVIGPGILIGWLILAAIFMAISKLAFR